MGKVIRLPRLTKKEQEILQILIALENEGMWSEEACKLGAVIKYRMNTAERRITKLENQIKKLIKSAAR